MHTWNSWPLSWAYSLWSLRVLPAHLQYVTTGIVPKRKRTVSKVNVGALWPEPKGMNKVAAARRLEKVGFLCAQEDDVELPVSLHQAHER